jgi:hypothetical protein
LTKDIVHSQLLLSGVSLLTILCVVPVSSTELVPEYGYNKNFPVIFLRKAWPGTYSMQPYSREKGPKSNRKSNMNGNYLVGPPPPASLFYRFGSLEGTPLPYAPHLQSD